MVLLSASVCEGLNANESKMSPRELSLNYCLKVLIVVVFDVLGITGKGSSAPGHEEWKGKYMLKGILEQDPEEGFA